jgi:hypothetical protein
LANLSGLPKVSRENYGYGPNANKITINRWFDAFGMMTAFNQLAILLSFPCESINLPQSSEIQLFNAI